MRYDIVLFSPDDAQVEALLALLFETPSFVAHGALLFGGDRWHCATSVAIAFIGGQAGGMATLAPTNELGSGGPRIIALWIDPEVGSETRREIGGALLTALIQESQRLWQKIPAFSVISETERQAALAAQQICAEFTFDGFGVWQW